MRGGARRVLPPRRGLVDRRLTDRGAGHERARDGHRFPRATLGSGDPLRPWTQFGSWAFTDRAKASGLVPSMGSIADCFDNAVNAVIESFWSRMQVELLNTATAVCAHGGRWPRRR